MAQLTLGKASEIVREAGEVIGAVGVTGDVSEKDEACAITGIEAVGFETDPS